MFMRKSVDFALRHKKQENLHPPPKETRRSVWERVRIVCCSTPTIDGEPYYSNLSVSQYFEVEIRIAFHDAGLTIRKTI